MPITGVGFIISIGSFFLADRGEERLGSPLISCRFLLCVARSECFSPITKEARSKKKGEEVHFALEPRGDLSWLDRYEARGKTPAHRRRLSHESVSGVIIGGGGGPFECGPDRLPLRYFCGMVAHQTFLIRSDRQYQRRGVVYFRKSLFPAINNRLTEFKDKSDKRKGENTKKKKRTKSLPSDRLEDESKTDPTAKKGPKTASACAGAIKLPRLANAIICRRQIFETSEGDNLRSIRNSPRQFSHLRTNLEDFWRRRRVWRGGESRSGHHHVTNSSPVCVKVTTTRIVMLAEERGPWRCAP